MIGECYHPSVGSPTGIARPSRVSLVSESSDHRHEQPSYFTALDLEHVHVEAGIYAAPGMSALRGKILTEFDDVLAPSMEVDLGLSRQSSDGRHSGIPQDTNCGTDTPGAVSRLEWARLSARRRRPQAAEHLAELQHMSIEQLSVRSSSKNGLLASVWIVSQLWYPGCWKRDRLPSRGVPDESAPLRDAPGPAGTRRGAGYSVHDREILILKLSPLTLNRSIRA